MNDLLSTDLIPNLLLILGLAVGFGKIMQSFADTKKSLLNLETKFGLYEDAWRALEQRTLEVEWTLKDLVRRQPSSRKR